MTTIQDTTQPERRKWWRYFSIAFAILLIVIILRSISFEAVLESISTLDRGLILFAFVLNIIVVMLMALRWRVLYQAVESQVSYSKLLKVTFVSIFFNTILPSIVGGDTYRTLVVSKDGSASTANLEESFSVIFVDRIMGLVGLMLLGCAGLALNKAVVIPSAVTIITITLLIAFVFMLLLSMFNPIYQLLLACFRWLPDKHFRRVESILNRIHSNIALYRNRKWLLFESLIISLIQRLCWLFSGFVIAQSLQLNLTLMVFIMFLPIIEIIRLIPLTIQGIGVREGMFILFFGTLGVTNSEAVLLATLIYLMSSLIGLLGGGIYLLDNVKGMRSSNMT